MCTDIMLRYFRIMDSRYSVYRRTESYAEYVPECTGQKTGETDVRQEFLACTLGKTDKSKTQRANCGVSDDCGNKCDCPRSAV